MDIEKILTEGIVLLLCLLPSQYRSNFLYLGKP